MTFDHYAGYEELKNCLEETARRYPDLCTLTSIGKTRENRDIFCMTLTDPSSPIPAGDKPAFLIDGNLHSGEVASSMTALYCMEEILRLADEEEFFADLLFDYRILCIPRINADAAEKYLTTPYIFRGSTEPFYPEAPGVKAEDLNGDGEIVSMRIQDPAGRWKVSGLDPRIMERRAPGDLEGPFYTLTCEGLLQGDDPACLTPAPPREDLDPNRQFPFEWKADYPEGERPTSGPEPLHDAEVRCLHDFISGEKNLRFIMNFHTFGGLHISPAAFCPHLTTKDAEIMEELGDAMSQKTGYRSRGIFPEGAKDIAPGSYTPWAYYEKGILGYVTELWDFHRQADPERPEEWSMFFCGSRAQFEREQTSFLRWDDTQNASRGFMPWTPFHHPQLGEVELGGWREKFTKNNPPPHLLRGVCEKGFAAVHCWLRALPRLDLSGLRAEITPADVTFRFFLKNTGYLPTATRQMDALDEAAAGLTVEIGLQGDDDPDTLRIPSLEGYSTVFQAITCQRRQAEDLNGTFALTVRAHGAVLLRRQFRLGPGGEVQMVFE